MHMHGKMAGWRLEDQEHVLYNWIGAFDKHRNKCISQLQETMFKVTNYGVDNVVLWSLYVNRFTVTTGRGMLHDPSCSYML